MERKLFGYPLSGVLHMMVVYIVWSSTYLAIRIAVTPGGWPPFFMGCTRMLTAALLLFALAAVRRHQLLPSRAELPYLAATGTLMWALGHGLVLWAEQRLTSSYTSLLIGSTPILVTIIDAMVSRRWPGLKLSASLCVGFAGLFVLMSPSLSAPATSDLASVLAVLVASACWGGGTLLQNRRPFRSPVLVVSAFQHLSGGIVYLFMSLVAGEPMALPTTASPWLAWSYLLVFGSIIAFTSYTVAVKLLPVNIATSYAYINPVLAMLLGWLLLDEIISTAMLVGALLVISGVFAIYRVRLSPPGPAGAGGLAGRSQPAGR
ncbi:MAG: EamA family transporter [Negativicutes bacterium]|nr:EamA family transporter [Negativicutes bacterium]